MMYGILLAAGTSSRMGQPKQLLDWRGQPLVRHVAMQALQSQLDGLVVVVGAQAGAVRQALAEPALGGRVPLHMVENVAFASGQASSLRVGLAALPGSVDAVLVLLVDQPLVTTALINGLIAAWQAEDRKPGRNAETQRHGDAELAGDAVRSTQHAARGTQENSSLVTRHSSLVLALIPRYGGQRGNPVLLARGLFAELQALQGDEGARGVLQRHSAAVHWLEVDDPAVVTDVDTLEAYERLKRETITLSQGKCGK